MLELRERRRCYSDFVEGVSLGLAFVDGVIAFLALYKLIRIHSRNTQLGWTRQKVIHLLIGSSNLGFFLYFVLNIVATCKGWICWSYSCGFVVMAFPRILLITAFLLLLSFWVDLCHHSNDDDDDDGYNSQEPLLDKMNKTIPRTNGRRRCCSFRSLHIGSRQKIVILVTVLVFAIMVASSVLIWIGMGNSSIQPSVVAQVYVDLIAVVVLLLGGALACYGVVLFLKMRKVRSEQASSETWKVAGLAIVSVISFTSSASIAICTHIPLFYDRDQRQTMGVAVTSLLLVLYYFIGSSLPSAVVLYLMRELPAAAVTSNNRRGEEESTRITFIDDGSVAGNERECWTRASSVQNQVSRASPI